MDLSRPPASHAELHIWKVFVRTYDGDRWQIINRWVRDYGNPFEGTIDQHSYEEAEARQLYQLALQFCYNNR